MNNIGSDNIRLIPSLLVFQEVVRWRSYTKAAAALGLSKSAVSQHVTKLEAALKTPLLTRNTRNLSVTEAGHALFENGQSISELISKTLASSSLKTDQVTGTLSVTAPHILETGVLAPALRQMRREFPSLRFKIDISDKRHDLIKHGFDVALTGGPLPDSTYKVQKIANITAQCYASPALVKQWRGCAPEDIENIPFVLAAWQKNPMQVLINEANKKLRLNDATRVSSITSAVNLAASDMGCVMAPVIAVKDYVKAGKLARVFGDVQSNADTIYFLHAFRAEPPIYVARFRELIRERIDLI